MAENRDFIKPRGQLLPFLYERNILTSSGENAFPLQIEKARRSVEMKTNRFSYGIAVTVPDILDFQDQRLTPMIYINEAGYGIPSTQLEEIPDLIIFEDKDLINYLIDSVKLTDRAEDSSTIWVFPGGGGRYMRQELEISGIVPSNFLEVEARRQWGSRGGIWCNVNIPLTEEIESQIKKAKSAVFIDDTICTGSTIAEVFQSLEFYYYWKPDEVVVAVEALASPRKKEQLNYLLSQTEIDFEIHTGIFYGGETQRPRLLSTGSIVRGQQEPQRFSEKKYPPELIEKVRRVIP